MKRRINPRTLEITYFAETDADLESKPLAKDCTNGLNIWKNQRYKKYKRTLNDDILTCPQKYKKLKKDGDYYDIVEMTEQEKDDVIIAEKNVKWAENDEKVKFLIGRSRHAFDLDFAPTQKISKIDINRIIAWRLQLSTMRINFANPYDPILADILKPESVVFTDYEITDFFIALFND